MVKTLLVVSLLSSAAAIDSICSSTSQWNAAGTYTNSRGTGSCTDAKATIDQEIAPLAAGDLASWCTKLNSVWTNNQVAMANGEALHGYLACCIDSQTVCDTYMPNICNTAQFDISASVGGQGCAAIMWASYIGYSPSQVYCDTGDAQGVKASVKMAAYGSCCTDQQTYCTQYLTNPCTGTNFNPAASVGTDLCSLYIAPGSGMPTITTKDEAWCDAVDATQTTNYKSLAAAAACCTDGLTFCAQYHESPCNKGTTSNPVTYTATNSMTPVGGSPTTCGQIVGTWGLLASQRSQAFCSQSSLDAASSRSNGATLSAASACCSDGKTFCSEFFSTPCTDDTFYNGAYQMTLAGVTTTCDAATGPWGVLSSQKNGAWCTSTSLDASNTAKNGVTMDPAKACCTDRKTFCTDRMTTMCKVTTNFQGTTVTVGGGGTCQQVLSNLETTLGPFQATTVWCQSVSGSSTKGAILARAAAECCQDALSICDVVKVNPCVSDTYFVPTTTVTYENVQMLCGAAQYSLASIGGVPTTATAKTSASAAGGWCSQNMNNDIAAPTNKINLNTLKSCCADGVSFCPDAAPTPAPTPTPSPTPTATTVTGTPAPILTQAIEQYATVSFLLNSNPLASISLAASFLKDIFFKPQATPATR